MKFCREPDRRVSLIFTIVVCIFVAGPAAQARKFDFKAESLATYFKGTYGPSAVGTQAFGNSSGTGTEFDQYVGANYSGEFGLIISMAKTNFRIGAEYLIPEWISDVRGTNASGTELFLLDTETSAIIPSAHIDWIFKQTSYSKLYGDVGVGYAMAKLENQYTMTAEGTSSLGASDYIEKGTGTGIAYYAAVGFEVLLADTATVVFDLGYRYLKINELKYVDSASTIHGDVTKGATVTNADGSNRALDMSGGYVGMAFRFYIGL